MRILTAFIMACCLVGWLPAQTVKRDAAACVQALQAAIDRGETNAEALLDLTESCILEGQAATAQRMLLALHDGASDPHVKLALLRPLKWAAGAAWKMPELVKLFAARHDAQPGSALACLEHAEVEGASHSYPAQRANLTKAATLGLGDEALLREVVDRQEEAGFWDDALSTAESWAQRHATPQAKCRLACLHLIVGDDARAWALASEAVKDSRLAAGDLQELARVACELHAWEHVAVLLTDALLKFSRHLGLLSLQAVALEEAGRDDAAAKAFLHLLSTREALVVEPAVPSPVSGSGNLAEIRSRDFSDQPPGTRDFVLHEAWSSLAYVHRAAPPSIGDRFMRHLENVVHVPVAQDEARIFALLHLWALNASGAKVLAEDIKREMAAAGMSHLALNTEPGGGKPVEIADVLKKNPDNEALHAWWLGMWHGRLSSAYMQVMQHCVDLFAGRYPVLAFTAAKQLANSSSPEQERYQQQALTLFQVISKTLTPFVLSTVYRQVEETKTWKNAAAWQDATIAVQERAARELPDDWVLPRTRVQSRYEVVLGWLVSLEASQWWEQYARALEEEARHQAPTGWIIQHSPFGSYGQGSPLLGKDGVRFPNVLLRWPQSLIETFGVFHDVKTRASSLYHPKGPWIGMLRDPWLKLVAQWRHGEAAAARAEMERRLAKPDATLADLWLGAWLAWEADTQFADEAAEQAAIRLAAERLAKAATFPLEGIVRSYLDAALLRAVLALHERPPALVAAAHDAAKRFCSGTLASEYDGKDLKIAFETLGFTHEAALVEKIPVVPHPNESLARIHGPVPASTLACLRRSPPRTDVDDRQGKKALSADIQVREAMRQLHQLRPDSGWGGLDGRLMEQWKTGGIWDAVLAAAKPQDGATARELLRAGQDFELLRQPETARQHYETALQLSERLDEARVRLVILALPERGEAALALLKEIKAESIGPLLEKLGGMASSYSRENRTAQADATMNLLTRWLQHLTESCGELPTSSTLPLQHLMLDSSERSAELCRTALAFRELADIAFGSIAEDALRKKRPLTDAAVLARDLLKAKAVWAREPQRSFSSTSPTSAALPADGVVTQPGAALILVWDAWQRQAGQEVESTILPLLSETGKIDEAAVRAGAALFFCAPDQFVETAGRFLQNEQARRIFTGHSFTDRFFAGGTLDFITLVWRLRKLDVSLEGLFLAELAKPETAASSLEALAGYIGLEEHMTVPQARSFVRGLRDLLVDPDPARRRAFIGSVRESGSYTPVPERWQRQSPVPPGTVQYVSWLRKLLAEPRTCRAALEMAVEDGLAGDRQWRANDLRGAFWELDKHGPQHLVALLDGFAMLAPAKEFRTWAMEPDPSGSLFDTAVDTLIGDGKVSKPALEMVKAIQPETFGTGMIMAWAAAEKATDESGRKDAFLRFVKAHGVEFKLIPAEHWQEIGVFLKSLGGWSKPWHLSAEEKVTLAPVVEAQGRYLAWFAGQVMAVNHWDDFHRSGYAFIELSSHAFISLAEAEPTRASALAVKVLELLEKPARIPDPHFYNTPENPRRDWLFYAAETSAGKAVLRALVKAEEIDKVR
ncbi:MAG: tetratricopeptide repeat protein [Prosthecobacter sp.]|uniref:tetratricopeptide repeat protein n=1 Tax=Prosthecobacter sp. TaxID=1965333 RepID=UPI0038FF05ED